MHFVVLEWQEIMRHLLKKKLTPSTHSLAYKRPKKNFKSFP